MKTVSVAVASVTLAFALTGCGLLPPAPLEPPVTETPTETPTPTPTPEPTLAARTASTPFDAWDAYLACTNLTLPFFFSETSADPAAVVYDSFGDSFVHLRPDGLYFVYSEVENGNGDPGLASYAAANCIIGGTLGVPRYELYGATARLSPGEISDAADAALATE